MRFNYRRVVIPARLLAPMLVTLALSVTASAQSSSSASSVRDEAATRLVVATSAPATLEVAPESPAVTPAIALYFDPLQGASSADLISRALASNGELSAARLDLVRGRARLRQAGLRPNPTLDFEQTSGRLVGSPGESATSIGVAVPLELGGQRRRRIELAQAELDATEAEIADRERQLTGQVLTLYAEALSALRELETTEGLMNLDMQTTKFVQVRVNEGETAPLELNLLRAEVDRLRSRGALVEGRLRAALVRLKNIVGIRFDEPLRLRESLATSAPLREPPASLEAAIEIALRTRPDLRLARLNEEVAQAGLRLARTQAFPDVTVSARYSSDRTLTDLPEPLTPVPDRSRALSFGVSIGLPVFNKNQGAKIEAATAIEQAARRREFLEQTVRAEVTGAYARLDAARIAVATYEQGVIPRSNDNLRVIRAAYAEGAFTITEVIAEQRRLVDSQREFTEALSERYNALADLQTAIGKANNAR